MTEPSGWLDMSRFPDHDPDTVLSADQHGLLTSALVVDDTSLPDAVWDHMLAVVVGSDELDDTGTTDDPEPAPDPDDPAAADLEHVPGADDHAVPDDHHDPFDHGLADHGDPAHPGGADGMP